MKRASAEPSASDPYAKYPAGGSKSVAGLGFSARAFPAASKMPAHPPNICVIAMTAQMIVR